MGHFAVYTSYFKRFTGQARHAVSVARSTPTGFKGLSMPCLFPPSTMLWEYKNGVIDKKQYVQIYKAEVLDKLDPFEVAVTLGEGAVLLCWEGSAKFCHRHEIANWLNSNGIVCEELP